MIDPATVEQVGRWWCLRGESDAIGSCAPAARYVGQFECEADARLAAAAPAMREALATFILAAKMEQSVNPGAAEAWRMLIDAGTAALTAAGGAK